MAELRLNPEFTGDLASGVLLHPGLLDIATGFAMQLAEDYDPEASLWAPATYGRVFLHEPLPAEIVSLVRLADSSDLGEGYAAFDVTIADRNGQVLFEAFNFVMRRLENDLVLGAATEAKASAGRTTTRAAPSPAMLKLGAQVRNGILPLEGFEALVRVLGTSEPQPIVSSIDLDVLKEWVSVSTEHAAPAGEQTSCAVWRNRASQRSKCAASTGRGRCLGIGWP